jgi:putative endonuclease
MDRVVCDIFASTEVLKKYETSSLSLGDNPVNNAGMNETKIPGVYIMGNDRPTLYVGVSGYLPIRILEHKQGKGSSFTRKYKLTKLLYYEYCETIFQAIIREKQIKKMLRKEKLELIRTNNKMLIDIFSEVTIESDLFGSPPSEDDGVGDRMTGGRLE